MTSEIQSVCASGCVSENACHLTVHWPWKQEASSSLYWAADHLGIFTQPTYSYCTRAGTERTERRGGET